MTPTPADTPLERALRTHWQDAPEPADSGFSCRVMAAIKVPGAAPASLAVRGWHRRLRWLQWLAVSCAALLAATLLTRAAPGSPSGPDAAAAGALLALLIFWTVPNRWHRR